MRSFLIILTMVFITISGGNTIASVSESKVPIGDEFNPTIIDSFPLPDIFFSATIVGFDNNNHLWISGATRDKNQKGENVTFPKLAVIDISNPLKPKLLVVHDSPGLGETVLYDKFAYALLQHKAIGRKDGKVIFPEKTKLIAYDISDVFNPKSINEIELPYPRVPHFYIDRKSKTLWMFENYSEGSDNAIDQTVIHRISLENPEKPKLICSKYKELDGKVKDVVDGYISDVLIRENYFCGLTREGILAFDTSSGKEPILMTLKSKSSVIFQKMCEMDEYLSRDESYILAAAESFAFNNPGENPTRRGNQYETGLLIMNQSSFPHDGTRISPTASVKIPFRRISEMYSKGTLAYVVGHEEETNQNRYQRSFITYKKLLVVDFTDKRDPQYAGSLSFDGSITDFIVNDSVANDTIAYILKLNQEGIGGDSFKRKYTFYTVKLPVKEEPFKYPRSSMADMFPGYIEPEYKPKSIEIVLREKTGKGSGVLIESDFKNTESLELKEKQITDLNGIQLCTNLKELDLSENQIADITPLTNLRNLKTLTLKYNKIENLEPLKELTKLESLTLSSNEIKDITPILNLPNLRILNISNNPDIDLSPISQMKNLTELNLSRNNIFKPDFLSDLKNLKKLDLSDNDIYHMDFIDALPSDLEELDLSYNNIRDLSKLTRLVNLKKLKLKDNNFNDISPLKHLANLEELSLYGNDKISDIKALSNLTNLKNLDLSEINIDDITPLENLVNLEKLDLGHINYPYKYISDIKPLANLKKLKVLNLEWNKINNVKPLSGLTNLVNLNMSENEIENIEPLKNLANLETLRLLKNKITSINPLIELLSTSRLKNLSIPLNPIKDAKALLDLDDNKINPDLVVQLTGTQIPQEQIEQLRKRFYIAPMQSEGISVINLRNLFFAQEAYFNSNGNYAADLQELTNTGFLFSPYSVATLNTILSGGYKVVKFQVNPDTKLPDGSIHKSYEIVGVPKSYPENGNLRIFAICEDGLIREWMDNNSKYDISVSINDKRWKIWSKNAFGLFENIY